MFLFHTAFRSQSEMNAKIQSTEKSELPALFSGAVENVSMYARADYCEPLQTYISQDTEGWEELDGTWVSIRSAYCDTEGNQIGYPIGFSYPGIYYNVSILEEAGIDASEIKSYTDLYEACKTIVDGGYATYGIGFHTDGYYFNAALGREGIQTYNNNNGLGSERITECLYTSDQTVHDAIYNMLDVYQKLHAENLCIAFGADYQAEIIPQIASGDCAMMMGVVSMTTKILDAVDGAFEVGIIPMISATENGMCTGEPAGGTGTFIGNNGNEEQMQGAYDFIKFASTADEAAYFSGMTGYLAPNEQTFESGTYQTYAEETFPAVTDLDQYIGRLMEACGDAGALRETNLVLVSDHGQQDIKRVINLNVLLADRKYIDVDAEGKVRDYRAFCFSNAMSALVYLKNPEDGEFWKELYDYLLFLRDEGVYGIGKVFTGKEIDEREHLSRDFSLVIESDGYTSFTDRAVRPLVQNFDENDYRAGHATHGYLPEYGPQPVFLAKGPDFRQNTTILRGSLIDEAPTYAAILGVTLKEAEGKAMKEFIRQR